MQINIFKEISLTILAIFIIFYLACDKEEKEKKIDFTLSDPLFSLQVSTPQTITANKEISSITLNDPSVAEISFQGLEITITPKFIGTVTITATDIYGEKAACFLTIEDDSKILYTSIADDEYDEEIWTMNGDGSNQIRLTNNSNHDNTMAWSPDQTMITFVRYDQVATADSDLNAETPVYQIYTMQTDGSNEKQLTSTGTNVNPKWSPNGNQILFSSYRDGEINIFIMDIDGSNTKQLTQNYSSYSYPEQPKWLPSDGKIIFIQLGNIYLMNIENYNQENLTSRTNYDNYYFFNSIISPDGSKILAHYQEINSYTYNLSLMDIDGSNLIVLASYDNSAEKDFYYFNPAWSPDSSQIAYSTSENDLAEDIFIVRSDGTNKHNITEDYPNSFERDPSWSLDGSRIVFRSNRDGETSQLYIMKADGSKATKLSTSGSAYRPMWFR